MTTELKKNWLYGEQMEGFLPCPFSGELPYIKFDERLEFASSDVMYTCWLKIDPVTSDFNIRIVSNYSTGWGYTKEQCKEKALADVKKRWNTRK